MGVNYDHEERRGEDARRILEDELYKEAFAAIEARLVDQLALAATTEEQAHHLRHLLIAHRKVRQYMANVLQTGTMAALEINRQQTLAERMRSKFRAA